MKKALTIILILVLATSAVSGATFGKSFKIDLTVESDGDMEIHNFSITRAERSPQQTGNHSLEFQDKQNNTVYSYNFDPEFQTSGHTVGSGDQLNGTDSEAQKRRMGFWLPYNKTATKIVGKYDGEVVSEISITQKLCQNSDNTCSSYCSGKGIDVDCTCGDDVCQESTNEQELCPQDCSTPKNNPGNQENSSEDQTREVVDSSYSNYILIAVIVAAVLVGLFLVSGKVKIEA
jgi:hypothetical protein